MSEGLFAAVRFLTILPAPAPGSLPGAAQRAVPWYAVAGLLVAAAVAAAAVAASAVLPAGPAAAVAVTAWVVLTGALHLDGLADSADAACAAVPAERRLEILRDVHHGTFAVVAVGVVLVAKFSALASVDGEAAAALALVTIVAARAAVLLPMRLFPPARAEGMGAAARSGATTGAVGAGVAVAAATALVAIGVAGLLAVAGAIGCALAAGWWLSARFGGLTGDAFGAIIEVTEVVTLLVATALLDGGGVRPFDLVREL